MHCVQIKKNFQTNSSENDTKTIFRDHIPTFHVFRVHSMLASELSTVCLKNDKAQFKVPLRRFLNTQSFYSLDEFLMCKDNPSFIHQYSALEARLAGSRAQSCDLCGSGTLHPGQVLGGSLPLLSPAFRRSHFCGQVSVRPQRRERS